MKTTISCVYDAHGSLNYGPGYWWVVTVPGVGTVAQYPAVDDGKRKAREHAARLNA